MEFIFKTEMVSWPAKMWIQQTTLGSFCSRPVLYFCIPEKIRKPIDGNC
jgi:hypothetical protein